MEMEISFPVMPTTPPRMGPTKINTIVSNIPLSDARVINLILLVLGASLNFLILIVIVSRSCSRTPMNMFIISLAFSNMVILIEPLEETIRWFFGVDMKLNMDYVCMISFDVSVVTIALIKFMQYIRMFQEQVPCAQALLKNFTAMKGIVLVWSATIISLAIGLHIYDFFEGDMADIYVWNTIMFIAMPVIISLALDALIIYELFILKSIEGEWRWKEVRHYIMLIIIAIAFLAVRTPYRLARAINFIEPKASCCTAKKRELLYFIAKTYPTVFSLIYIALSNEFQEVIQILKSKCKRSEELTVVIV
ncbi:uncharacterized protein LOC108623590 [Ceratina calcarata]|uniref:Uncharacterized protein LOC108623590 n=1 Tax=Ceratina calcarata TaxID=156304 RepID=A0AAJ7IVQ7_9HYME|nr:uncharacterized protein LOC108623590 [Ceratina calcarata]